MNMLSGAVIGKVRSDNRYSACRIHARKSGPSRSKGMKPTNFKPGSKLAKQAMKGVCTVRSLSATMIYFYNKRFKSGKFSVKVM